MAGVGSLVNLGMGILGLSQQRKAAKAQERAMRASQKAQELADARDRRKLLRQTSITRGEALNFGANLGAMGGSALAGGLSGITNQQQAQLGFQQTTLDISKYITRQNIRASQAMTTASLFGGLGEVAGSTVRSSPYRPVTMTSFTPQITTPQVSRAGF